MSDLLGGHGHCDLTLDGPVATIWLTHGRANALDIEMVRQLGEMLKDLEEDQDIRAIIFTGRGKLFSSGIDLLRLLSEETEYVEELLPLLSNILRRLFSYPKPTVAAVNGAAVAGGCLLACACDHRLMTDSARIGVTELGIGVAIPSVAIEVLRHAWGSSFESLLLNAELLTAPDALKAGVIHEITTDEDLIIRANEQASRVARFDPRTYEIAKDSSRQWATANMDSLSSTLCDLNVLEQWSLPATRNRLRGFFPAKSDRRA